jgi:outer membrane protein assembly factor BamB
MITSISAPITHNAGQPQNVEQSQNLVKSGPSPTSGGSVGLADSPWPMFRQNLNHTGVSPYDTSLNPGKLKWTFTTGGRLDLSSPVIGPNETVYIGSQDCKLVAINEDGTQKWNFTTNGSIDGAAAISSDGTIYVGSRNHKLYAINPNGTEKWNFTTGDTIWTSSPVIGGDGTIYIGCYDDSKLYAINSDGSLRWTYTTGGGIRSTPAISHDGTIYIGSRDRKLYAINPDGSQKWSYTTPGYVLSSPAIGSDGTIYVGSYDTDPTFHAINPDGTKKWSFIAGSSVFSSPAIGSDGVIYFGTHLYIYALYPDGNQKWKLSTVATVHSSPAIGSDGTIYVGAHRNVLAINPDGTEKWNFATGDTTILSSPAIGSDGTIYIGCLDKNLYAIGTPPNLNVNITSHFSELNSAAQSAITVHVTDGTNPVQGATVNLDSDNGGIFSPLSGITDANGDFKSIFNAPTVTTQIICRITAEANKIGYNNGSEYVDVTINPIPWPMFRQNLNHTGQSPYDTSMNNGKLKWSFLTGDRVVSSPAIGFDGTIYVGSYDNKFYAINPDGTEKWYFTTDSEVFSSPTIDSYGTIYVGSHDNKLYAINPDGTEKWNFITSDMVYSSPTIGSDGTIYVGSHDHTLYAINPDGTPKWNFTTGQSIRSIPTIGFDGTIYISSYDHKIYAINPDGSEKWNFVTGGKVASSPAISSDGTIYVGSQDEKLYAINQEGIEKWNFTTSGWVWASPAIGSDGTIYIGSYDDKIYAISVDGYEKWNFITDENIHSSPAIGSDGTIYSGSDDGILYAIYPDGSLKWNFTTDGIVFSSPAIDADGTIYVGSYDNKLYAIDGHNQPPIANAGSDQTLNEGDVVQFNGSASYDPDGYVQETLSESQPNYTYPYPWGWTGISFNAELDALQGVLFDSEGNLSRIDIYINIRDNLESDISYNVVLAFTDELGNLIGTTSQKVDHVSKWYIFRFAEPIPIVAECLYFISIEAPDQDAYPMWYAIALLGIDPYPKAHGYLNGTIIDDFAFKTYLAGNKTQTLKYEWDFDSSDGLWWETGAAPDATGPTPTHIYGDDGIYIVTLRVTDNDNLSATDTCNVTVQNVDPTVTIESITMEVEIGLRVAGRKYNNVSMTLYEEGSSLGYVSIERLPGSPNEQMAWIPVSINFSRSYNASVTYTPKDPPNIGGNPVWIYIKSKDGTMNKIHHTFNVQQSKKRDSDHWNHVEPWEVDLNGHFIGLPFEITSHVKDPGSDDETMTFTYGSQVKTVIYLNNPPNPDPYPSPEVNPVDIMDTIILIYEGAGTVTLVVKDDDNIRLGIGEGTDYFDVG